MYVRIMVYSLFICSIYQNSLSQQRNFNYTIQGFNHKVNQINLIDNKDKNANNQRNNTQVYIERSPWWLNLKRNRTDNIQTATGIPSVKEIELYGRRDARRGRSYYAEHSTSQAAKSIICLTLQLILFGCLPCWLNKW